MTLERYATAVGAGHPQADAGDQPAGALVNLAETTSSRSRTSSRSAAATARSPSGSVHPLGVYSDDCRFLSGHELCGNDVRPRLLVAS